MQVLSFVVLSDGVEPSSAPSEGAILSIERREPSRNVTIFFYRVLSDRIELSLPAPQAGVLSVERREQ